MGTMPNFPEVDLKFVREFSASFVVRGLRFLRPGGWMIWCCLAVVFYQSVAAQEADKAGVRELAEKPRQWRFTDISGQKFEPFGEESVEYLVVVFIAVDCPIANYYQPTLKRLATSFEKEGVRFALFHTDPDLTPKVMKEHATKFEISLPVFLDGDFALAKRLKATTMPEAFVISRDGQINYRGRIDGSYAAWGKKRREPGTHDLQEALKALIAGQAVKVPVTKPIGCYIPFELAKKNAGDQEAVIGR